MDTIFSFHKTVQGYNHIKKNIPCEDASNSYSDSYNLSNKEISCEDTSSNILGKDQNNTGTYYIAVIADGHGDPDCFRSAKGAQFAVDVVTECFKEFAQSITEDPYMFNPLQRDYILRHLTDVIVCKWNEKICDDISKYPIEEVELQNVSEESLELYRKKERLTHIYGSTVIGSLLVNNFLILIQQGDGRCEVIYENGNIDQPIPWDDRCFMNVTTSLCDEDALVSFRHAYIDLNEQPIAACFVGSDGVEDSYLNMEGTHRFYRERCIELIEKTPDAFLDHLDYMLPDFSKHGSGDDVSISGIVFLTKLAALKDLFTKQNNRYSLEILISSNKKKLISMSRRHSVLSVNITNLEKDLKEKTDYLETLKEEFDVCTANYKDVEAQINERTKELHKMEDALATTDDIIIVDENTQKIGSIKDAFKDALIQGINDAKQAFFTTLKERKNVKEAEYRTLKRNINRLSERIETLMLQLQIANEAYHNSKEEYERVQIEFLEIDSKKRRIEEWLSEAQKQYDELETSTIDKIPIEKE